MLKKAVLLYENFIIQRDIFIFYKIYNKGKEMEKETKVISKKKVIGIAVVVVIAAYIIFRFTNKETVIEVTALPTVSVGSPEIGDISVETSLIGKVEPGDVYYVMPKTSGEILNIYVQPGDYVNAGDPICDIDNQTSIDSARVSLDSAQIALDSAIESASVAKVNYERMQTLFNTGDISQQSLESAKSSYDQANAAVESSRLQLESAQLNYDTAVDNATVTAPVDGIVESTNMSINATVSQSSNVCVISSNDANKLTFSITDRLLSELSVGTPIKVTKQGTTYEGTITRIETLADETTGLYPVEAAFEGSDNIAKGASVKVYFDSESSTDTILVNTDSVYYDGGNPYIYTITYNDESEDTIEAEDTEETDSDGTETETIVAEGNRTATIHKNAVEVGISNSEKTEILSGISEDSIIVNTWTSQLYEGAQVQVLPTEG